MKPINLNKQKEWVILCPSCKGLVWFFDETTIDECRKLNFDNCLDCGDKIMWTISAGKLIC